jgi:hypothetical protein
MSSKIWCFYFIQWRKWTSFPPISQKYLLMFTHCCIRLFSVQSLIHSLLQLQSNMTSPNCILHNSIKIFNNKKYLENVTLLDLSNNSINSITPAAIENLQKEISLDLSNNELKTFPRPIQTLNPCKIQFGDVILDCNCNNEWIKDLNIEYL